MIVNNSMKVFLAGGTGFLGSQLLEKLLKISSEIVIPTRKEKPLKVKYDKKIKYLKANLIQKGGWEREVKESDIIINLAGYPIYKLWIPSVKKNIWESRVNVTSNIVSALSESKNKSLINASAIGIYGDKGNSIITEDTPLGNDKYFLVRLCKAWEKEALKASSLHRVYILRIGVVIGEDGGFKRLLKPFLKLKTSVILCNPDQWISWIDIRDFVDAVLFIIDKKLEGIFNISSSHPLRQKSFCKNILDTRFEFKIPCSILKFFGEQAETFTWSQRVIPKRLLDCGFKFKSV